VDFIIPINEMAYVLVDLYSRKDCKIVKIPKELEIEAAITLRMSSNIEEVKKIGVISDFTCPDCGGILTKTDDDVPRYRCFTGHTFTEKTLANEQSKGIEESLWIAIRMMEERKNLLIKMENSDMPSRRERALQLQHHIERLKTVLVEVGENLSKNPQNLN
jgi:two-component system chemotaxis response regulator CheB